MIMSTVLIGVLLAAVLAGPPAAAAGDDLAPFKGEQGRIRIAGGTAHIPVMKAAAERVMRHNPKIRITVAGGGSGVGIKQVGEGLVDIGNSGRRPTAGEISRYGLKLHRWAVDGVAVAVNPQNPVRNLSYAQLRGIYAGRIRNWREVGGPDRAIHLYTRDKASGTRAVFWKKALNRGAISPGANFVPSNGAMKTALATDPGAIGYLSAGFIDTSVAAVALEGVMPSRENIAKERYPVSRGLYSNTRGEPRPLVQKFIAFLYSPSGRKIIAAKGFIPVGQ
jgi:phosphate transport system substrate-binding protein